MRDVEAKGFFHYKLKRKLPNRTPEVVVYIAHVYKESLAPQFYNFILAHMILRFTTECPLSRNGSFTLTSHEYTHEKTAFLPARVNQPSLWQPA